MQNKKFIKVVIFYGVYSWFVTFSGSILPTHFLEQGLNYSQMIFGRLLIFAVPLLFLLVVKSFSSRNAWRLTSIFYLFFILLSIKILSPEQFYLANAFYGASLVSFFVFYNIAHFKNSKQDRTGNSSAIMFSVGPIISVIAPLASGYIANFNYTWLWILAIFSFVVCFLVAEQQENFSIAYRVRNSLREIKATRLFIFIEGVWEAVPAGLIPVFTLYFIKDPLPYGSYIAYLSLISVLANLLLGRFSDRIKKRSVFIYPLTIALAISTALLYFGIRDLWIWVVATSLVQFFLPLFWNISTAMVIDTKVNLTSAIVGREIMLTSGRIVGLFLAYLSLLIEKTPKNIFIFLGCVILLFPLVLFWNAKLKKNYQYL